MTQYQYRELAICAAVFVIDRSFSSVWLWTISVISWCHYNGEPSPTCTSCQYIRDRQLTGSAVWFLCCI